MSNNSSDNFPRVQMDISIFSRFCCTRVKRVLAVSTVGVEFSFGGETGGQNGFPVYTLN